ncbi:hypothetical protein E2P81_ATG08276 [Venturia nashicola]|uniref:Rhodopsin domain-containing protein n=1 Tax=Venturia nashicola TaxID=86259 RepID=A0A4Z1NM81_9PEZI|nr:hypothetical protein E6O75_ATG08457 [Venturia nashicola]TLD21688.1 hypothetical protein E2P81_ATG08276 [Venturia nashicola]
MSPISQQDQSDFPVASRLLGTSLAVCLLTSTCVAARLWFRYRISRLGSDDLFILAAMIFSTIGMILALNCLQFEESLTFKPPPSFQQTIFFFFDIHVWTVVMIKTSLAFMLLRFHRERAWKVGLYTLIAVQTLVASASTLTNYLRCMPVQKAWSPNLIDGYCMSERGMRTWMLAVCAFSIITDAFYTIVPLTDILRLDRSLRERLALCLLMSVTLLATAASIIKTSIVSYAFNDFDDTQSLSDLMLCSLLELFLGIMGACLPCLKQRFERALYWTKRRTICFWGERVDWGDSLTKVGTKRDGHVGDEREFGCTLGLGDSSAGSENFIPLAPVRPESTVMLDGYILDSEGQWRWSASQAFEIPMPEQITIDEQADDGGRTKDDARRTIDLMIDVPEAVVLYGVQQEDPTWIQGPDAFRSSRLFAEGVMDVSPQVLQIMKTTSIDVVKDEKPVGWDEMELGFGIKRIWAEHYRHSRC